MIALPLETFNARYIDLLRHRQAARGDNIELRFVGFAAFCGDAPARVVFLISGRRNAPLEADVTAQVEAVCDMVGIAQNLGLGRILFAPYPFLLQLFAERVGVVHALHVAARPGIAIPVPGATDIVGSLEHDGREPELPQSIKHVHAGKAGARDDGVVFHLFLSSRKPDDTWSSRGQLLSAAIAIASSRMKHRRIDYRPGIA